MTSYLYDNAFFEYTTRISLPSARRIVKLVSEILPIQSVLDVGCAQGAWLSAWRDQGVRDGVGLDGSYVDPSRLLVDRSWFQPHDLATPFQLGRRFDLAQSLEVAEHLPRSRSASFVRDITSHSHAVLFSAAPPGQGGEHHINEQPYAFWRSLFAAEQFEMFDCIRPYVKHDPSVLPWYRFNPFLFVHRDRVHTLASHVLDTRVGATDAIEDVSPALYRARKQVIRALPYTVHQLLARAQARWSRWNFERTARTKVTSGS